MQEALNLPDRSQPRDADDIELADASASEPRDADEVVAEAKSTAAAGDAPVADDDVGAYSRTFDESDNFEASNSNDAGDDRDQSALDLDARDGEVLADDDRAADGRADDEVIALRPIEETDADADRDDARALSRTDADPEPQSFASSYASTTSDGPTVMDSLKTPLLAIAAAVALMVAGWSYSSLEQVRSELAKVAAAKASVDQSLADAQARLTAAEKAVADVKAALSAVPAAAPAAAGDAPQGGE